MSIWSGGSWFFTREEPTVFCNRAHVCPLLKNAAAQAGQQMEQVRQRNIGLARWQENLHKESTRLKSIQEAQQRKEAELAAREQAVRKVEAITLALSRQKEAAEQRIRELEELEQKQEDQISRFNQAEEAYRRERQAWESARPVAAEHSGASLEDVKQAFMQINQQLRQTREQLLELTGSAGGRSGRALGALCRLYRDMIFAGDGDAVHQLGAILQLEFGVLPLEPVPGDIYDPCCHERTNAAHTGQHILCCRARGWLYGDEVLLRAVVETEERSETV